MALGKAYAHFGHYELALSNLGQAHLNATTSQNQQMIKEAFRQLMQIVKEEQQHIVSHRKNIQLLVLADDKKKELIAQLEQLMKEQKVYCENLLTKERVAEMLQTNRTYLSQVINEVYGKSFTQYINDLRIEEAVRRLDDPANRRALRLIGQDLGFNSPTTFNTQFQQRTGVTPAQYRQKVRLLEHHQAMLTDE